MIKTSVAIIGAGPIAEEYIKILSRNSSVKILGVVGKTSSNSKKLSTKYNIKYHGNNIKYLLDLKPNIVIVAVNILNTINVIKQLSKYSGILLIEKPLGVNHEETKKILKILNFNKQNSFVALNRRFYDNILFMKKILSKDNSNKIITITDQENTIRAKKIGHKNIVLKNWMYANSIHLLDLLIYFGNGEISKIRTLKRKIRKEFIVISELYFKNNNIAIYKSIWNRPGPWSIEISSSKYYFNCTPIENLEYKDINNKKKLYKNNSNSNFKPGFENMINTVLKFYKLKNKNINKNNLMLNSLLNISDYFVLSKIIKKIYL